MIFLFPRWDMSVPWRVMIDFNRLQRSQRCRNSFEGPQRRENGEIMVTYGAEIFIGRPYTNILYTCICIKHIYVMLCMFNVVIIHTYRIMSYRNLNTFLPTYIYLYLPISTYIYLYLPISTYIYLYLPTYLPTYEQTYSIYCNALHYITLHHITLHCIAFQYITVDFISLHSIACQYLTYLHNHNILTNYDISPT